VPQNDRIDPDFPAKQGGKGDLQANILHGCDVQPLIQDVHIVEPNEKLRKDRDSQSTADFSFHTQGLGGVLFQAGFIGLDVNKKEEGD
jgi:hypothetical protein